MTIDETIAHEPDSDPRRPAPEAPEPRSGGAVGRYFYTSGARPLDGYTIKRAIGRGGFGEVYYALTDAGKEVALKLVTRNLEVERRGAIQCMNLKSPHLIAIHDLRSNAEGDSFVIMEYVAGPSLANILESQPDGLPLHEVRHWLKGLVAGVAYLHDHGIVHRDLKPANVFMEEGVVKIGDYGLSKAITNSREPNHSQSVGTCHYMAPEIGTGKYHKPIDIYAMGVILYEMLTGRVPFDGESVHEVLMKHLTDRADLSGLPDLYRGIVAKALAKRPEDRPARVADLLLPADAPREQAVRFIAEGKGAGLAGAAGVPDEVLLIGQDDPVLYIGPDTMPPKARGPRAGRLPAPFGFGSIRKAVGQLSRPVPPTRSSSARRPAPPPPEPPTPPPEPPPLPSARLRVGELATSMLAATPLAAATAVLTVPAFELLGGEHPSSPAEVGFLALSILIGAWVLLVGGKLHESGFSAGGKGRIHLGLGGLILGAGLIGLLTWTEGNGLPTGSFRVALEQRPGHLDGLANDQGRLLAMTGLFFGLTFAATGARTLMGRDRRWRIRLGPIVQVAVLSLLFGSMMQAVTPQPWAGIVAVGVAVVVQVVSPWSPQAADLARLARVGRRRGRGRQAA